MMPNSNEELFESFLKNQEIYGDAPSTMRTKRYITATFVRWLDSQGKHLFDVSRHDIEDWLSTMRGIKVSTKVTRLATIKKFYDYLLERKHISENPFKEIAERMNRSNKKKVLRPILSVEDVAKIIKAATNPRDRAILLTFYKTGLRAHELIQISLDNINWKERRIRIPKRKGGHPGDVYFDEECERALKLWMSVRVSNGDNALFTNYREERLKYTWIDTMVKEASIKSGVGKDTTDSSEAITPNVFRYAFTTHLAANRCHPKVIQMLRGDSDATMLDRYTQFTPEQVRQEYLRAIPKLGV